MKRSKLYREIVKNNAKIEQENRERIRLMYNKYREAKEAESEVKEDAKTEKI